MPSPLLAESDEDAGAGAAEGDKHGAPEGAKGGGDAGRGGAAAAKPAAGAVRIDLEGFQSRIDAVAGVPEKPYAHLAPRAAGTVYYLETNPGPPNAPGGTPNYTLQRFKLSERKPAVFATEVADFAVSADGKKLVYRAVAPPAPAPAPG